MKKGILSILVLLILISTILSAGCSYNMYHYRANNPDINVTPDIQYNGSYKEKTGVVVDTYIVSVLVFNNNRGRVARDVRFDRFTYCNDQNITFMTCIEDKKFLAGIGDIKPKDKKILYTNFERPAWQSVPGEKFTLTYSVSCEFDRPSYD